MLCSRRNSTGTYVTFDLYLNNFLVLDDRMCEPPLGVPLDDGMMGQMQGEMYFKARDPRK